MLSILVIDNNPHFIHAFNYILQDTFTTKNIELHIAESSSEALTILGENNNIDVVFLDVDLPQIDGIETTKKIRSEYEKVKIIALSFYEEQNLKNNFIQAGAKQYVVKENITAMVLQNILT
ncbi:MAG: response regulator [Bacteroidales bacterium]|nr:response regulator [Bacteroidales bacterium]NLK80772.1 response regulator [Bacteroidales bacterium]HPY82340.1 response regulator [Bacteroidales bacterium]